MSDPSDLQAELRQPAVETVRQLSASEHAALLIKCWMSHDARWFMAVAQEFGIAVANRLNQRAAHAVGKVEAQRVLRALQLPPVSNLDDYLAAQEVMIALLGPDLLNYGIVKLNERAYQLQVRRCFAHENAERAGILEQYECGILARLTGWFEALGLGYALSPEPGKCLKLQGGECSYTIALKE